MFWFPVVSGHDCQLPKHHKPLVFYKQRIHYYLFVCLFFFFFVLFCFVLFCFCFVFFVFVFVFYHTRNIIMICWSILWCTFSKQFKEIVTIKWNKCKVKSKPKKILTALVPTFFSLTLGGWNFLRKRGVPNLKQVGVDRTATLLFRQQKFYDPPPHHHRYTLPPK